MKYIIKKEYYIIKLIKNIEKKNKIKKFSLKRFRKYDKKSMFFIYLFPI